MHASRQCAGVVSICVAYACEEVKGVGWYVLALRVCVRCVGGGYVRVSLPTRGD